MARNQKREVVELRWHRLLLVLGLVVGIAVLTVGYVLQRRAHDELGVQIKAVEREIGWARERVREARGLVERSRRKDVLIARAQQMDLQLVDIQASQRLTIPLMEVPAIEPESEVPESPVSSPVAAPVAAPKGAKAPKGPMATAGRLVSPR
jgi:hypothetical protein